MPFTRWLQASKTFIATRSGLYVFTLPLIRWVQASETFITPRSGLYVFNWTIRLLGNNSYYTTELLVDNNVVNWLYFNPTGIDGSVTGTVVVQVNQGDYVLIRTGPRLHTGTIVRNLDGKSSFAGWMLM